MPSPIGHVLGGIAGGWLVGGRNPTPGWRREAALFGVIGAAPDIDLLFGAHSTYTHSAGAVGGVALAALIATRGRQPRIVLACAAAIASHILLDWLGSDTTPPIGIMALWPFTRDFYQSPFFVFMAISRRWWQSGFYRQNGLAVLRELAILVPIDLLIGMLRVRAKHPAAFRHNGHSSRTTSGWR
jgi:inner membrane protein